MKAQAVQGRGAVVGDEEVVAIAIAADALIAVLIGGDLHIVYGNGAADSSTERSLEYTSRPTLISWRNLSTRVLQMGPSSVWAL